MADGGGGPDQEVRYLPGPAATARHLLERWPSGADGPLVIDGRPVDDDARLDACGLVDGATVGGPAPTPRVVVVAGPLPATSIPLGGPLLVGRGAGCGLRLDHRSVRPAHALIEPAGTGWTVCRLDAAGDCTVGGADLDGPRPFEEGTVLTLGAVHLQLDPGDAPVVVEPPRRPVHRAAHRLVHVPPPAEPPEPPAEPAPPTPPGALTLLGPVVVGIVLAVAIHPTAGLFTAATPLLAVATHLDARRRHRRERRRAAAAHAAATRRHADREADRRRAEIAAQRAGFPTPVEALARARRGVGLWASRAPDRREVAVGWTADRDLEPAVVDLADHRLGIAGPRPWADDVARALVLQLTARLGPADLHLDAAATDRFAFARWLPHRRGSGDALALGAAVEVADHREQLTDRCRAVLVWSPGGARLALLDEGSELVVLPFVADADTAEAYGRASARWSDPDAGGASMPDAVSLASLLDPRSTPQPDDPRSLACPIGVGREGPVTVDLVAQGPHALVAGTTGAGKSELLRTWVTGLALRHGPARVAFVLVDYKGGSAFDACARLPHVTGVVTDLDPGLGERLLVGLRAEVLDREARLRAAGAADLAELVDGPPRLVVVVDEFATLASELSDFLGALIDVARRGRSLGVHLVLATQRPAGAVSDEIRANTALRLCLRVLDPADSQDVLGTPAAASLPTEPPGRAWLRAGDEPVLFQVATTSGRPVERSTPPVTVRRVGAPGPGATDGDTELATLVERATTAPAARPVPRVWLPPLPERLLLPVDHDGDGLAIGRLDLPADRRQPLLRWRAEVGHLVVVGGRGRGSTTAVLTALAGLATTLGPEALHVHAVDGGRRLDPLAALPHTGSVVRAHDRIAVRRLLGRVRARMTEPGALTAVAVDGLDALASGIDDLEGVRLLEDLDAIARLGPAHGTTLVLTARRPSSLPAGVLATADVVIALGLDDPADYGVLGLRPPATTPPPGRGRTAEGHEVQLALAESGSTSAALAAAARHGPPPEGTGPVTMAPLPDRIALGRLDHQPGAVTLGLRDRDLLAAHVVLRAEAPFVIAGPPRSGRSTALRLVIGQTTDRPRIVHRSGAEPAALLTGVERWLAAPGPVVIAVDGAEHVADPEGVLEALVTLRHPHALVVVSVRADAWRGAYRGWLAALRPAACGLALAADPLRDADCWSAPLTGLGPGPPPGRGLLVSEGTAEVVQVAAGDG